jgi:hypothetical protein
VSWLGIGSSIFGVMLNFDGLIGCSGSPCTGSGHSIMAADYQLIQEFETFRKKR